MLLSWKQSCREPPLNIGRSQNKDASLQSAFDKTNNPIRIYRYLVFTLCACLICCARQWNFETVIDTAKLNQRRWKQQDGFKLTPFFKRSKQTSMSCVDLDPPPTTQFVNLELSHLSFAVSLKVSHISMLSIKMEHTVYPNIIIFVIHGPTLIRFMFTYFLWQFQYNWG